MGYKTSLLLARSQFTTYATKRNIDESDRVREIALKENIPLNVTQLDVNSDSDLFILHQRCLFYGLQLPFELRKTYARFKDKNKIHIDSVKVFEKLIIQNGVFEGRYRTTDLNAVSLSLLHICKYSDLNAGLVDVISLSVEEQEKYVMRDAELT